MRIVLVSSALVLSACLASPSSDCFEVPAPAELRGGGWDLNGRTLGDVGALDVAAGAGVTVIEGRLVGADGVEIERGHVVASGAGALDVRLVRVENGVPLYDARSGGLAVCDGLAVFVPGTWTDSGAHAGGGITVACEHGAIAECALWGYAPWVVGEAEHAACTRMVRADYCGDGASWTVGGTPLTHGDVAALPALGADATLEAGWSEEGAVCVHASRWEVLAADGSAVRPSCWASLPRCETPAAAIGAGALLVSGARPAAIAACR